MASLVDSGKIKIFNFTDYARCLFDIESSRLSEVPIFSDEYAPVELLTSIN
jgi:hypothetical protein